MFKFGFVQDKKEEETSAENLSLDWISAEQINISPTQYNSRYNEDEFTECKVFIDLKFDLIRADIALKVLTKENCTNIVEAESQHSDLIPAKYEGGLKVWECSYDLGKFLLEKRAEFNNKRVLDLGCGAGIIGLIALLKGSVVHFQDYNVEVLKSVTIPNVLRNYKNYEDISNKCEFYSGDWASFTSLSSEKYKNEDEKYDLIMSSETIYNPDNHRKLYEVFKRRLKKNGVGFVAAKVYYFGVGGGMRQFENLVKEDAHFQTDIVWKSKEGLQREILRLRRK